MVAPDSGSHHANTPSLQYSSPAGPMRVDVLTIFPEMFASPMQQSIMGRAQAAGLLRFRAVDLRDFTTDRHRTVDDTPFGGGAGMVMKPEPIFRAVEALIGGYLPDADDARET